MLEICRERTDWSLRERPNVFALFEREQVDIDDGSALM